MTSARLSTRRNYACTQLEPRLCLGQLHPGQQRTLMERLMVWSDGTFPQSAELPIPQ